tara:strand:+ start:4559 stop:4954 length:396 start_codon:yes stop_codon:yes gene_type:complete
MTNEQNVDPGDLVQGLRAGQPLSGALVKSLVIHGAVVLLTSIPYLAKVLHYGSFDIRAAAAVEQAVTDASPAPAKTATDAETKPAIQADDAPSAPAADMDKPVVPDAPSAGEVSREKPADSSMNVDDEYGL